MNDSTKPSKTQDVVFRGACKLPSLSFDQASLAVEREHETIKLVPRDVTVDVSVAKLQAPTIIFAHSHSFPLSGLHWVARLSTPIGYDLVIS